MTPNYGITILDRTMTKGEVKIVKSPKEIFGFNVINETGQHLFIEPVFSDHYNPNNDDFPLQTLIIRSEPK